MDKSPNCIVWKVYVKPELLEVVKLYAKLHKTSVSKAISEICEFSLGEYVRKLDVPKPNPQLDKEGNRIRPRFDKIKPSTDTKLSQFNSFMMRRLNRI